jgi:hypothetical protein
VLPLWKNHPSVGEGLYLQSGGVNVTVSGHAPIFLIRLFLFLRDVMGRHFF